MDLVTFQSLDIVFNNVRQVRRNGGEKKLIFVTSDFIDFCLKVSVLEEKLCDPNRWRWTPFDQHIDRFNLTKLATGKVILRMIINITNQHHLVHYYTLSLSDLWVTR